MNEKKLGLPSVIAVGVGLIVATSCLMSLGQGAGSLGISFIIAMVIACFVNIMTALSLSELNALMPNLTGGLAQYTLACMGPFAAIISMVGGYLVCNTICGSVECAMFGNTMNSVLNTGIPSNVFCVILLVVLIAANLNGLDIFAKIQNLVAYGLIISLVLLGLLGFFGIGTGTRVKQPLTLTTRKIAAADGQLGFKTAFSFEDKLLCLCLAGSVFDLLHRQPASEVDVFPDSVSKQYV